MSNQVFSREYCVDGIEAYKLNKLKLAEYLLEKCKEQDGLNKQSSYLLKKIYIKNNKKEKIKSLTKKKSFNNQIIFERGKSENSLESGAEWYVNYNHLLKLKDSGILFNTSFQKETRNYDFGSFQDSKMEYSILHKFKRFNYKLKGSTLLDTTENFYANQTVALNLGAEFRDLFLNFEFENSNFEQFNYRLNKSKIFLKYLFLNHELGLRLVNGYKTEMDSDHIGNYGIYLKLNLRKVSYTLDFEEGKSFDPLIFSQRYSQFSNKFSFKINNEYDIYGKQSVFNNKQRDEMRYSLGLSWKF